MATDTSTRPGNPESGAPRGKLVDEALREIRKLLSSADAADLRRGLELVRQEIARVGSEEARPLFEAVSSVFYLDPLDRPDLVPVLDEAVGLVAGFGEWVIPILVDRLEAGDVKAQLAAGHALGRIGADAIAPLVAKYDAVADPAVRPFVLYALGKIGSPRVVEAVPMVLEAAGSEDLETRDTAARALGRMADSIPAGALPDELGRAVVDRLHALLADPNAGVRAKAVRSLGKLAKGGHMTAPERETLAAACRRLLGEDGTFEWDRAWVVRREAETALVSASG
jgi:HEAT repeat protein